ncbi:hypothetical protein FO519_008293, partial [Halicephalobus sp. NKZ332]
YWIGINDVDGNGWQNVDDGSKSTFFHWASGEPSNTTNPGECVSMDVSGYWYNDNCLNNLSYICGINQTNTSSTVVPQTTRPITTTQSITSPNGPPPPTTIPNCQYTSQDFILSVFLDVTTFSTQGSFVLQFLRAIAYTLNPAEAQRYAYFYNTATGSNYISGKINFTDLASEYIDQEIQSMGVTTVSLNHAFAYYQQNGPTPNITTTIAPTIIMVTSNDITDLDQTKPIIDKLRQDRTAYIVSVTLSSDATSQLSNVGFDLAIELTNGIDNAPQDAATNIINMICSVNNNH